MHYRSSLLVAIAFTLIATIKLYAQEPKEKAFAKLKGDWIAEKVLSAGKDVPAEKFPFELQFADDKLTFKGIVVGSVIGKDRVHDLVLDASADPCTMDITRTVRDKKLTVYAIYKFDRDRLLICFVRDAKDPKERPTSFDSSETVPSDLLILKRKPPPQK
jgi:uncharacterized protein (TIGR03067 family)